MAGDRKLIFIGLAGEKNLSPTINNIQITFYFESAECHDVVSPNGKVSDVPSLGRCIPWSTCLLVNASLRRCVPGRCVPTAYVKTSPARLPPLTWPDNGPAGRASCPPPPFPVDASTPFLPFLPTWIRITYPDMDLGTPLNPDPNPQHWYWLRSRINTLLTKVNTVLTR